MQCYPTASTTGVAFRLQARTHHTHIFCMSPSQHIQARAAAPSCKACARQRRQAAPSAWWQSPRAPKIECLTSNCHVCVAQLYIGSTRLKKLCFEHKGRDRNSAISPCFAASSAGKSFWSFQSPYPCQPLTLQMQLLFKFSLFLAWSKTELHRKRSPFIPHHASAAHGAASVPVLARYFWTSDPHCPI